MEFEKKRKTKLQKFILILTIIAILASGFLIYQLLQLSSIETLLRMIAIGLIIFIDLIILIKNKVIWKNKKDKNKNKKRIGFIFFLIIYSLITGVLGGIIFYFYSQLSSFNKEQVEYTSNLVALSSSNFETAKDVEDSKIAILSDEDSPDGYLIPQDIIKEFDLHDTNEVISYDDYNSMVADLYAEEIDLAFLNATYIDTFNQLDGYQNIATDTKVIHTETKKFNKSDISDIDNASKGKDVNEPFTMLLMGVDSTTEVLDPNAAALGDTLILVTFNPKTLNATMLSVPRDSYIPISCWSGKPENKITHAAAYGNDCMINSLGEYFDLEIDYYAKINFKGFVKLIDAVGGVEVDVPYELCTDNSSRNGKVCISQGTQTLAGEEALVFARNRKQLPNGDFGRAQHQQEIVMALTEKVKTITDVSVFMDILDTISNSLDTNLTTDQLLSFYDIAKDILTKSLANEDSELINMQQLYLSGSGQTIYDERSGLNLWNYVPIEESRDDITEAMKVNLELEEAEPITEFSFSINEPYEKTVIGEGPYNTSGSYNLVPNLIGYSEATARSIASRNGLSVTVIGSGGTVIKQNYPAGKRTDLIGGSITITMSGEAQPEPAPTPTPEVEEESTSDPTEDENQTGGPTEDEGSTGTEEGSTGTEEPTDPTDGIGG